VRVLSLTEGLGVTESGFGLFAVTDCKEERAAAIGLRIKRMFAFFVCEDSEGKGDTFSVCFFYDIFGDTI